MEILLHSVSGKSKICFVWIIQVFCNIFGKNNKIVEVATDQVFFLKLFNRDALTQNT